MSYRKHHVKRKIRQVRPKKKFYKKPVFWILILTIFAIFFAAYMFLFFSGIQVKEVIVLGNEKLKSEEVAQIVMTEINKNFSKSIFLADPEKLNKELLEKFPIIEKVFTRKKYPKTITLGIAERKPIGVFCSDMDNKNCFLIDQNGIAFEPAGETLNFSVVRKLPEGRQIFAGEKAINENIVGMIMQIEKNLKDNFQINLKEALISTPSRIDVITEEGWQIYFDSESDIGLQIAKMNSLLEDESFQGARPALQYVDLRFNDRAYYK